MARPMKPYTFPNGKTVLGIRPTGQKNCWRMKDNQGNITRFFEPDPQQAYLKFLQLTGQDEGTIMIPAKENQHMTTGIPEEGKIIDPLLAWSNDPETWQNDGVMGIKPEVFWGFLRNLITKKPELVAEKTGIKQIAHLETVKMPNLPVKLSDIRAFYETTRKVKPQSKRLILASWENMVSFLNAETVKDLTRENLIKWKNSIPHSDLTKSLYFDRIKTILRWSRKGDFDNDQITKCLDNECQVLFVDGVKRKVAPTPISREDFQKLYQAAPARMKALMLVGLNCCLHLGEATAVKWIDFDMAKGTYSVPRGKTGVAQIAVLWPETTKAIKALPKKNEYVFGTKRKRPEFFRDLADSVGITAKDSKGNPLTFEWLRDAAYETAWSVSEQQARNLAGHASPGQTDAYVLRNPETVRAACSAIREKYLL